MGVACFRRSYSKTQSSGGGGGKGGGGGGELNRPREKKEKNKGRLGREVPSPFPSLVAACIFPRQIFARALLS